MEMLVKQLAIRLSHQKTLAKSLVMVWECQPCTSLCTSGLHLPLKEGQLASRVENATVCCDGFSIALHAFALFGIALVMPDPRSATDFMQPLQVVLVNTKSKSRPAKADALAQANLDGGGNTPEDRQAKTPLPAIRDDQQFTPEQIAKRVAQLEEESKRMPDPS